MIKKILLLALLLIYVHDLKADETEAYIKKYRKIAVKEMKQYGIPASITLAQGILESGNGKSRLAVKGKNHFGIKCTSDWTGRKIREDDDKKNECFRRYRKAEHSYRDHSEFIAKRDRYKFLFDYDKQDYKAWANGLKKAGYATNPNYPQLLIRLIERYDLDDYDKKGAKRKIREQDRSKEKNTDRKSTSSNEYTYHEVKKGDTLYSISKKYNVSVDTIKSMNNKRGNEISVGEKLKVRKK